MQHDGNCCHRSSGDPILIFSTNVERAFTRLLIGASVYYVLGGAWEALSTIPVLVYSIMYCRMDLLIDNIFCMINGVDSIISTQIQISIPASSRLISTIGWLSCCSLSLLFSMHHLFRSCSQDQNGR